MLPERAASMNDPIMLRAYSNGFKGATAFFRNRPLIETLFEQLTATAKDRYHVLVHACSIGAEPYSLAMWWHHRVQPTLAGTPQLRLVATDANPEFLAFARAAQYPRALNAGMTSEEQSWFDGAEDDLAVPETIRSLVSFTEPMNFVEAQPEGSFDAVLILNALTYVTPEQQTRTIEHCADYCRDVLALTAFHPDTIAGDLHGAGFEPVMTRHRAIHESWGDRLAPGPVPAGTPEYSWRLPPYETGTADYAYRYGSLFARRPARD